MNWPQLHHRLTSAGVNRRVVVVLISVGVLALAGYGLGGTVRRRVHHTCVKCRAERCVNTIAGIDFKQEQPSELTPVYKARFADHEHVWTRSSCYRGFSLFGFTTYFGCGPMHPIRGISSSMQLEFIESATSEEIRAFYTGVLSEDRKMQTAAIEKLRDKLDPDRNTQTSATASRGTTQ